MSEQLTIAVDDAHGPPVLSFSADPPPGAFAVDPARWADIVLGLLVYATTQSGKSYLLRGLLEQTHGHIQHIVIDSEGEFSTLRERFAYLLAAAGVVEGDVPATVEGAPLLCRRIMELGVSAILDISDMAEEARPRFIAAFLTELLATRPEYWRPVFVVIDEVHRFAPEGGTRPPSLAAISELGARGAKRGMIPILATQNIAKTSNRAIEEIPNLLVGRLTQATHRDRAAADLGLRRAEADSLKTLRRGQFYAFGPVLGVDEVTLVQTGPNVTRSPGRFAAGRRATPPPAPEAIRDLLAQFANLPQEAEQEAADLDEARRQIADLQRQLRERPRSEPVTVEKIVRVPVLEADQAQRMSELADSMIAVGKDLLGEGRGILAALARWQPSASGAAEPEEPAEPAETGREMPPRDTESAATGQAGTKPPPAPPPALPMKGHPGLARADSGQKSAIGKPTQAILDAIARFEALGVTTPARSNVAVWAGASPKSSSFSNNVSWLRVSGLVDTPTGQTIALTEEGRRLARRAPAPLIL